MHEKKKTKKKKLLYCSSDNVTQTPVIMKQLIKQCVSFTHVLICAHYVCLIIFISFVYVSQLPTLLEALYGNSSSSSDLLTFAFFFL